MKYLKSFNEGSYPKRHGQPVQDDSPELEQLRDLTLDIADAGFSPHVKGYISYHSEDMICYDIIIHNIGKSHSEVYDITKSNYQAEIGKMDSTMNKLNTLYELVKDLIKRVSDIGYYVGSVNVTFSKDEPYAFIRLFRKSDGSELQGYVYHTPDDEDPEAEADPGFYVD